MEIPVGGIAIVVFVVLLRHFARRRIAAGRGGFVWLLFLPTLLIGGFVLLTSIRVFASDPFVATLMAAGTAVYLALFVRFLSRLSRSVTSTRPQDDISLAITEPLADYLSTLTSLMLIGGLVAVVGLIIWGVSQATR